MAPGDVSPDSSEHRSLAWLALIRPLSGVARYYPSVSSFLPSAQCASFFFYFNKGKGFVMSVTVQIIEAGFQERGNGPDRHVVSGVAGGGVGS